MKIFCKQDGCHFPKEFKSTLKPPCNFWGDIGLGTLPTTYKKRLWDWLFLLPSDEIAIKFKLGVGFSLNAVAISDQDQSWEMMYPGYSKLSEGKQQEVQRIHFKQTQQAPQQPIQPFTSKPKKRIVN